MNREDIVLVKPWFAEARRVGGSNSLDKIQPVVGGRMTCQTNDRISHVL